MPSPAQNSNTSAVNEGRVKMTRSWVPSDPTYFPRPIVQTSQALMCPPTVVNQAVHGVRPMSEWSKDWFRSACRPQSFGVLLKDRRDVMLYEYENCVPYIRTGPSVSHSGEYWDLIGRWYPFNPLREFTADQTAKTTTLNKLSQKKWDLGVFAVELRQTAGLVTDLATGMAKTVENLINTRHTARKQVDSFFRRVRKHGSFDKAAAEVGMTDVGLLNTLKDRWMQYQFGIKPALNDVADATTYLASKLEGTTPMLVYAKGGHESEGRFRGIDGGQDGLYTAYPVIDESCQVHYSVIYEIPTGQVSDITQLGLDNPWNTAWEVTRLSWMVDYVVGMGDWLQSFTAANGMVFREGCRSVLRRLTSSELEFAIAGNATDWTKRPSYQGGKYHMERGSFKRELLESRLLPAVVPQIKSTLGLTQMANSIFALSNVFAGGKAPR